MVFQPHPSNSLNILPPCQLQNTNEITLCTKELYTPQFFSADKHLGAADSIPATRT